jgi:hypothetical protein
VPSRSSCHYAVAIVPACISNQPLDDVRTSKNAGARRFWRLVVGDQLDGPIGFTAIAMQTDTAPAEIDRGRTRATPLARQSTKQLTNSLIAALADYQGDMGDDDLPTAGATQFHPAIRPIRKVMVEAKGRRVHAALYDPNISRTSADHSKGFLAFAFARPLTRRVQSRAKW